MKRCILEADSVAEKTLNSNTSPLASTMERSSFQSNCSCLPMGVSNLGWGSGPSWSWKAMPCLSQ